MFNLGTSSHFRTALTLSPNVSAVCYFIFLSSKDFCFCPFLGDLRELFSLGRWVPRRETSVPSSRVTLGVCANSGSLRTWSLEESLERMDMGETWELPSLDLPLQMRIKLVSTSSHSSPCLAAHQKPVLAKACPVHSIGLKEQSALALPEEESEESESLCYVVPLVFYFLTSS